MKTCIIFLLIIVSGCQKNDHIKRTKQGEIETKITYLPVGSNFWTPTKSNKNRTIKEFSVSKMILVRGVFRHADFEKVLINEIQITAIDLCGNSKNIKEMDIEYSQEENTLICMGCTEPPSPPKFDYFFRAYTMLVCQQ